MPRQKVTTEMMRVGFDLPASTSIGDFFGMLHRFQATNPDLQPLGRQPLPGEGPSRLTGSTSRQTLLFHLQRKEKLSTQEMGALLEQAGFSKGSIGSQVDLLLKDKVIKRVDRGVYALSNASPKMLTHQKGGEK